MGKRSMVLLFAAFLAMAGGVATPAGAAVLEVGGGGSPYSSIQAAIEAAQPGDEVLVNDGIYLERIDLAGKAITVRSRNGAAAAIIDGSAAGTVVTFSTGEGPDTIFEGFTVRNGSAANGGGMVLSGASPTIRNCTISGNTSASLGGGVFLSSSAATFTGCTISGNTIPLGGGQGWGAGMYCDGLSTPVVTGCTIVDNKGYQEAGCPLGGGIFSWGTLTVTDSTISGNNGGGICYGGPSTVISNCVITGNTTAYGGGIYVAMGSASSLITNCTIAGNWAWNAGAGVYVDPDCFPTLLNCIIWGNNTYSGGYNPFYWYNMNSGTPAYFTVAYSNLTGAFPGPGNISVDPLFVAPLGISPIQEPTVGGDYHLQPSSPCIDSGTGDLATYPQLPAADIDGTPRPRGFGFDMGSDEVGLTIVNPSPLPPGNAGILYSQTLTAVGGQPGFVWSVFSDSLPPGLTLDPATGIISGVPTALGTFKFTIMVIDAEMFVATKELSITMPPLTIVTTSLPEWYNGTAKSQSLVATGGVAPYTWARTGGQFPSGLSLAPNGVIGGTPTATVSRYMTFRVTDKVGTTRSVSMYITVLPKLTITTASLANAFLNVPYTQTLAATGGKGPYTWSINWPRPPYGIGMADPSTGVISGTPVWTSGTWSIPISLTDANGFKVEKTLPLTVLAGKPDLLLTQVYGPVSGLRGAPITVVATVTNQGAGTASNSTLAFYLSTDANITAADARLGTVAVNQLGSGEYTTLTPTFTIPSIQRRTYYLGAIVDSTGVLAESNETNNALTGNQFTVQ